MIGISLRSSKAIAVLASACIAFTLGACSVENHDVSSSDQKPSTPIEAEVRASFSWGYVESTEHIDVEAAGDTARLIDKTSGSMIAEIFVLKDGPSGETKQEQFTIGEFDTPEGKAPILLNVFYLGVNGKPLHWNAAEKGILATEFLGEDGTDTLLSGVRLAKGDEYVRVSPEQVRPFSDGNAIDEAEPFWGVWIFASLNEAESLSVADEATSAGFDASVVDSSEWNNLNQEQWFCVTAGRFASEEAAEEAQRSAIDSGYSDAYVKHSGDHRQTADSDGVENPAFENEFFSVALPSGEDDWTVEGGITETREAMLDSQGNPVSNYRFVAHRTSDPSVGFEVVVLNFNIPSPPEGSITFDSSRATTIYLVNQGMNDDDFAAIAGGFMPI